MGYKVGETFEINGKVIGKIVDLRKGRKIIIQKPNGKRAQVQPVRIKELEEEDD